MGTHRGCPYTLGGAGRQNDPPLEVHEGTISYEEPLPPAGQDPQPQTLNPEPYLDHKPMQIDLNCDCGEGFGPWTMGDDSAMLAHVSSANIACGGHAGDPETMRRTVRLARDLGVAVGAHPGFPDMLGFGRRVLPLTPAEIEVTLLAQLGALYAIARAEGVAVTHVKPHGALYNHAAVNPAAALAIVEAMAAFDHTLILVALAGSTLEQTGRSVGIPVAREAFADRAYQPDGTLRPRQFADALILDLEQNLAQTLSIVRDGFVYAYDGTPVPLQAETICLHGDTPGAATRAAFLRHGLHSAGVTLISLAGMGLRGE